MQAQATEIKKLKEASKYLFYKRTVSIPEKNYKKSYVGLHKMHADHTILDDDIRLH